MTLNFPHTSIFPPREDHFASSMRFDDNFIMNGKYDFVRDKTDKGSSCESNDILDVLPEDPFGMDIGVTFTAISGWLDIFEMDALSFIWNKAMKLPPESVTSGLNESFFQSVEFDVWSNGLESPPYHCSSSTKICNAPYNFNLTEENAKDVGNCSDKSGLDPHEALSYVLNYLGVPELLSVERVCKSLHSAVRSDPFLWRSIYIDQSLNERIDDDALLWITNRAQGNLKCLSLVECSKVTDYGLRRVLRSNPRLERLSVPDCTKISIEGIVNSLKELRSSGAPGLKHLRVGRRYDVTHDHFDILKILIQRDECLRPETLKPLIYHGVHSSYSYNEDDERTIDIEICPICKNARLVYDCPVHSKETCRACTICIARCVQCGRCVNDGEYVETFCLDILCVYCCEQQPEVMCSPRTQSHYLRG